MKITRIVQQQRQKDRYSIYVDDKYTFSLSEAALLDARIHTGMEVTKDAVMEYKKQSVDDKAYNRVLKYVATRVRSEWEVRDYLKRKQVEEPTIEKLIEKLRLLRFIDDSNFARSWVENRRLLKPVSKRKLIQELKQKRVNDEIISATLQNDDTEERTVLRELVEKKRRQSKYQDNEKLIQYLARQGFGYNDIKAVLQQEEDF